MMKAINPATGAVVGEYARDEESALQKKVAQAAAGAAQWRTVSPAARAGRLAAAAGVLRRHRDRYAALMVAEMGKPIAEAEAEVDKCALACTWYAEQGERLLQPETHPSDAARSYVRFDPLGVVLAIMPWNFPFWQCFRFAAPALLAGNVGLLKHADNVPGCALAISELFAEAGFPPGCFQTLLISNERTDQLIADPRLAAVTLTGSERAGRLVAAAAGAALKKVVLELGGSDPFIVLKGVDIAAVAKQAASARCVNSGQSCIAAKRFIVEAPIAEAFEAAFVSEMKAMTVGDPLDRSTRIGPMARADLRDHLADQVQRSRAAGATLLLGGGAVPPRGFYFPPTVLGHVHPGMAAFDEETFGPVAAVVRAKDAEEAVALANASRYGLGASLWTPDLARAEALAERIEAGMVFINGIVKSIPSLPFGGIKQSGHGRELSATGLREFVNIKTVWVW
jgi:succinate-semialdehyde dehydrogenase/glutarate-semialdehyde dehydrogenase